MSIDWDELRRAATDAAARAYAPYSGLHVGAAAHTDDDQLVVGSNIENASYGLTLCAECSLVGDLRRLGGGRLVALVAVDDTGRTLMPCGRCRQILLEHGGPEMLVAAENGPLPLADLLPHAFDSDSFEPNPQ